MLSGENGIVYAIGEEAVAIRVGGTGDVTKTNTLWEGRSRPRFATPVLVDDHLFSISGSVLECLDAKTGEQVFQERITASHSNTTNESAPQPPDRGELGGGPDRERDGREREGREREGRERGGPPRGGGRGGRGGGGDDIASPVVAAGKFTS